MRISRAVVLAAAFTTSSSACFDDATSTTSTAASSDEDGAPRVDRHDPHGGTTTDTPIGLALDIEDGSAVPLSLRKHQTFFINYIDMRAHLDTTVDEGISALYHTGDFADLDWTGTQQVDQSFVALPNGDGTFTRRRFYRDAAWMNVPTTFEIAQLDHNGRVRGTPIVVDDGHLNERAPGDMFYARRLRGIQWAYNCASKDDCSTANDFQEEALVELRYTSGPRPTFELEPETRALRVTWTANPGHTYIIPVQQVEHPTWDYGFNIALQVTTPPHEDGTYKPGDTFDVKFALTDASGNDLAPGGVLPTFGAYLSGDDPSGIDYWDVNEPTMTYYRRKHKEKQMIVGLVGPVQDITSVYQTFDLGDEGAAADDVIPATPDVNGFFASAFGVPSWRVLLGIEPSDTPVTNTGSFTLPANAAPGTYKIVMKGRRSYMGEETPAADVISIQVGTPQQTTANYTTANCDRCHNGADDLTHMSHGFSLNDRETCVTCHVPLNFEPEDELGVRVHFVHSRSGRLNTSPEQCSICHVSRQTIQHVSKALCMSCHKSYPDDHVAQFGPIVDMYIGGSLEADGNPFGVAGTIGEAFQQCTTSCHQNHPSSGL